VFEVRRQDDGELCGHVRHLADSWQALTVFGGVLAEFATRSEAEMFVLDRGLSSLAEHWLFSNGGEWQVVCIQEASPQSVRIALDYYSMPGVATATLTRDEASERLRLAI